MLVVRVRGVSFARVVNHRCAFLATPPARPQRWKLARAPLCTPLLISQLTAGSHDGGECRGQRESTALPASDAWAGAWAGQAGRSMWHDQGWWTERRYEPESSSAGESASSNRLQHHSAALALSELLSVARAAGG